MGTFVLPPLEVFPVLDGLAYNSSKRPEFKSSVFEALSGKESRVSFRQYPKYSFALSFEFLDDNDGDDARAAQPGPCHPPRPTIRGRGFFIAIRRARSDNFHLQADFFPIRILPNHFSPSGPVWEGTPVIATDLL